MQRLKSLDILRGLTVALMILVNNGAGKEIYSALQHSRWNGLTPCDLVFPFFLYMVGMSAYLSLRKTNFRLTKAVAWKIAKRTVLLYIIGVAINWFDIICDGRALDFAHLRVWGVMQRIALCYGMTALLAVTVSHRHILHIALGLLIVYMGILAFGNGYAYDADTNILSQVDRCLFGADHLYRKSPVDPEGLLSTLPAIAHTLIGFWCCMNIQRPGQDTRHKMRFLKLAGLVMIVLSFFLSLIGFAINKRVWSPSYVFATCGFASWLLALLIQFVDHNKRHRLKDSIFTTGCKVFGMNALFLYVLSEALGIVFGAYGIKDDIYGFIHSFVASGYVSSLLYALFFVGIHAVIGAWAYRRGIFIKI